MSQTSDILSHNRAQRALVTVEVRRTLAWVQINFSKFVMTTTPYYLREIILHEIRLYKLKPISGDEDICINNVPVEIVDRVAHRIASMAATFCRHLPSWLDEDGNAPALVGYVTRYASNEVIYHAYSK